MTYQEQIMRLSSGRAHLGTLMGWFDLFEDWENYLKACVIFHAYDELLSAKLKENAGA